jgi:hypothetical protein
MTQIDTRLPPFVIGEGSPEQIAQHIVTLYQKFESESPSIEIIWNAAADSVELERTSPFYKAGLSIAQALDAGQGTGIADGYHNTKHYVHVLLNVVYLIQRNQHSDNINMWLTMQERGKLLAAAIGHDFYYELGGNKDSSGMPVPYRLENIAFQKVCEHLPAGEVDANDLNDIRVMIFGTDVSPASHAGAFVRAAHKHLFENAPVPTATDILQPVSIIFDNPRLARMTALLSDADIMASAGYTPEFGDNEAAKLRREWKMTANEQDAAVQKIAFLDNIVGGRFTTPEAAFFKPNMDHIRLVAEAKARPIALATVPPKQDLVPQ